MEEEGLREGEEPRAGQGEEPRAGQGEELEKLEITSDSEERRDEVPDWLREGEYVAVGTSKSGTVRYIGPTDFADGVWVGVELDTPAGASSSL